MKIKTLSTLFILCGFTFVKAQSPIPSVGPWTISGNSQSSTLHDGGVGTLTPDGKLEVKYQPCANQQNGLIVTSLGCSVLQPTYNTAPTDGILLYDPENPPVPVVLPPLSFSPAFSITTAVVPLVNINNKPMFWIRDENPPNNGFPGSLTVTSYSTKFIVLPNGHTGINTSNPRGTLDVVQFISASKNEPTAVFGKIVAGTQTQLIGGENGTTPAGVYGYRTAQIMIYNSLSENSYNRIVQNKDQAILFTDGMNSNGSNQNGCLVIAPWDADYTNPTSIIGGIRINKDGDVEVHGKLRTTQLNVNIKWWSDYVFSTNYNLISLDSVQNYIIGNGHLPGVPSEQTILDSGLNVADMQAIQMQKIEELTLYLINQLKAIDDLKAQLEVQQLRITELEAKKD